MQIVKVPVGDGEVDARLYRNVESADPVGGEDENAVIVFEDAEEDFVD